MIKRVILLFTIILLSIGLVSAVQCDLTEQVPLGKALASPTLFPSELSFPISVNAHETLRLSTSSPEMATSLTSLWCRKRLHSKVSPKNSMVIGLAEDACVKSVEVSKS